MPMPWPRLFSRFRRSLWWRWGIGLLLSGLAFFLIAYFVLPWWFPLPKLLVERPLAGVRFTDREGRALRQLLQPRGRAMDWQALADFPGDLVKATLAAEDQRFYRHGGIDFAAMARSLRDRLRFGRYTSGASTITQQLVKISWGKPRKRNFTTKFVEAMTARHVEMEWSKERILEEYLNRLDYGELLIGAPSAAEGFFGKPVGDLSAAECALLAGIPQSPGRLNPRRKPQNAKKRRDWVLGQMGKAALIDQARLARALEEPVLATGRRWAFETPHAVDLLLFHHGKESGAVRTTIDLALQHFVESLVTAQMTPLRQRNAGHAAVVVLDNRSGEVLALLGSRDYRATAGGQINGSWTPHSAGSTLKPFTYALGFARGFSPASILPDLPVSYATTTGIYFPENYDKRFHGPQTCRAALAGSLNVCAIGLLNQMGGPAPLQELLEKLGLTSLTAKPEEYGLGLTIGNASVRLLELANAYACLARLGEWRPWSLLADRAPRGEPRRVLDPVTCWLVADVLSDNLARARTFGMNSVLRLPFPVAGKTGTSTDFRDNWAMGFTPEFTVGVWVGNFDNTPMLNVSGVAGAGPMMNRILTWLHDHHGTSWYEKPAQVVPIEVDPRNGKRPGANVARPRLLQKDYAPEQRLPMESTAEDYAEDGAAWLPAEYREWAQGSDNWLGRLVAVRAPEIDPGRAPRLLSPLPGTKYYLDPDLPARGSELALRAQPAERMSWSSPTLEIKAAFGGPLAILRPGQHELVVKDAATGQETRTWVRVEEL